MRTIRILCLLLVVFSGLGMAGMLMEEPVVPIAINYLGIFVLSVSIAILASKRQLK
ncbi:hypothetical protein KYJ26_11845 [Bacillus sp. MCCB 382]|uniref:hypothetical protein n=1 Tax=Bacillus sp. MCCB 382 TaxID=2860197 RepID=UPI001C56E9DD|nr:hypothetical protein [Bacillus sp. MCCB 382]